MGQQSPMKYLYHNGPCYFTPVLGPSKSLSQIDGPQRSGCLTLKRKFRLQEISMYTMRDVSRGARRFQKKKHVWSRNIQLGSCSFWYEKWARNILISVNQEGRTIPRAQKRTREAFLWLLGSMTHGWNNYLLSMHLMRSQDWQHQSRTYQSISVWRRIC